MTDARRAARAAADALLLTDAPLLFPPGQLGLAAMRSGFNKVKKLPPVSLLLCRTCVSLCSPHSDDRSCIHCPQGRSFAAAMIAVTCSVRMRDHLTIVHACGKAEHRIH